MADDALVTLPANGTFPKVTLMAPSPAGFLIFALEIDRRPGPFYRFESGRRKRVLRWLKTLAGRLRKRDDVDEATVFSALVIPPGRERAFETDVAIPATRYDTVLLVSLTDLAAARSLMTDPDFIAGADKAIAEARDHIIVVAGNARRIAPVDHSRDGVFLFNYFSARSREQNLAVWEYTAGWFQDRTGLDNSTLFLPESDKVPYSVINHCRWDRLRDVVPKLIFEKSFRSYVLKHFAANRTTAMPILYRLA